MLWRKWKLTSDETDVEWSFASLTVESADFNSSYVNIKKSVVEETIFLGVVGLQ